MSYIDLFIIKFIPLIFIQNNIDLVVVGPEAPLVNGVHDYFLADIKLKNIPRLILQYTFNM